MCSYFHDAYQHTDKLLQQIHFDGYRSIGRCLPYPDYPLHSSWMQLIIRLQRLELPIVNIFRWGVQHT